jgi:hypothetical protein
MLLSRRQAILQLATLVGASFAGPRLLAASFGPDATRGFSAADLALLDEIGDTIIPPTDVPGAKAVNIGPFMAMMVNACYDPPEQEAFKTGLKTLADGFRARFRTDFAAGDVGQRTAFLNELDEEQRVFTASHLGNQPNHYFRIMKDLTVLGYFTSEIGATQALRYEEVPGRYDGDAPYAKGDRAWFGN